jgi:hypothetical protein
MKKNKVNLLIPFFVLVGLIIVLGIILWNEDLVKIFKSDSNVLERIEGYPKVIDNNLDRDRSNNIITSEQEFKDFVSKNFENSSQISIPDVNFSNQKLIIVISSTNETTGYGLKIRSVKKDTDDNRYQILSILSKPGETCMSLENKKNTAIDMVLIPNNSFDIEFNREIRVVECN